MTRRINKALCIIFISLFAATFLDFNPVYATPTIYMNPPSIIDTTMDVGMRFNITLWITGYTDVFAWQVAINYNNAIINCTGAWIPSTDPKYIFINKAGLKIPVIAFNPGQALAGDSLTTQIPASSPPDPDPAKLAIFEFEVKGRGVTVLNINHSDTFLLDDGMSEISVTKTNGYFENVPPATMSVDPPKIVDPLLVPSSNFNVSVKIVKATGVGSFEFKLGFNKTVLNVVDVLLGDFFPPSSNVIKTINNATGSLLFNASLVPSALPRSGNGTLAIIKFHVEGLGESILDLYDTKLADQDGNALPQTLPKDGYFNNILLAKLYVDPEEIIDPLLKPPKIFSVDIVIDDVVDLYGYEFKLSYNATMLTVIAVAFHPILNETNFTTSMMMDDDIGQIWIKVKYYSPAKPITTYTPESLVTLTFKVDAIGSSVLDLYDTKIWDSTGKLINHEVTDGFVMTLIRDVAIVNVVSSTSFAYAGALVNINVTAKNKGNNETETFDVKVYYDTNLIGTKAVTDLPPNAETTLTFTWNTSGVSDGIYTIKANATFVPYEFNTTDNVYIDGTVEVMTRIRDLAVLSVTVNPNVTYVGWPVNITVVVENQGMDPETFDVSAYWNDTNLIGKQTVTNLAPNTKISVTIIWDTKNTLVCHKYKISAKATILPFEIDTADNTLDDGYVKIKIMGDINGDGKVDIVDIAIAAKAFGSYPGHPRWNPAADLNKDGRIDIRDLAMVARNFGKSAYVV